MDNLNVAFIITVYKNDKLEYFREAIQSIINQDYGFENIHIYLGIDGDLAYDIQSYIDQHQDYFYKIVKNDENKGLAHTLNRLIDILENEEYVFRMDSDDISKFDRVTKQMRFMNTHKNISIIGGSIEEFTETNNVLMVRSYPISTKDAKQYIPKASIFAHPAVCFRKSFFEKGFRYNSHSRFSQDLELWFHALNNDIEVSNIEDVILQLRITDDFYKRRSYKKALGEFKIYCSGIRKLYGYNWRLIYPLFRLSTRLLPPKTIKIIYSEPVRRILNFKKN